MPTTTLHIVLGLYLIFLFSPVAVQVECGQVYVSNTHISMSGHSTPLSTTSLWSSQSLGPWGWAGVVVYDSITVVGWARIARVIIVMCVGVEGAGVPGPIRGGGGLFFTDPYIVSWLHVVSCRLWSGEHDQNCSFIVELYNSFQLSLDQPTREIFHSLMQLHLSSPWSRKWIVNNSLETTSAQYT